MLLPSGWLSKAKGGMSVAVKSLADGKAQGCKSLKMKSRERGREGEVRGQLQGQGGVGVMKSGCYGFVHAKRADGDSTALGKCRGQSCVDRRRMGGTKH